MTKGAIRNLKFIYKITGTKKVWFKYRKYANMIKITSTRCIPNVLIINMSFFNGVEKYYL